MAKIISEIGNPKSEIRTRGSSGDDARTREPEEKHGESNDAEEEDAVLRAFRAGEMAMQGGTLFPGYRPLVTGYC